MKIKQVKVYLLKIISSLRLDLSTSTPPPSDYSNLLSRSDYIIKFEQVGSCFYDVRSVLFLLLCSKPNLFLYLNWWKSIEEDFIYSVSATRPYFFIKKAHFFILIETVSPLSFSRSSMLCLFRLMIFLWQMMKNNRPTRTTTIMQGHIMTIGVILLNFLSKKFFIVVIRKS